jgi:hypothetical protein
MTLRVALALLAGCGLTGCSAIAGCGFERRPVKDVLDEARQIDLRPRDSTIASLADLPAPPMPSGRYDTRYAPVETTEYRASATLTRLSYSQDDRDYHLVLTDGAGRTMIAEAPDPTCAAGSILIGQIADVRARIDAPFSSLPATPGVPVTIIGVGFFDRIHNVIDQAPNGIELHPIVEIEWR